MTYSLQALKTRQQVRAIEAAWRRMVDARDARGLETDFEYYVFRTEAGLLEGEPLVLVLRRADDPVLMTIGARKRIRYRPAIGYFELPVPRMRRCSYHVYNHAVLGDTDDPELVRHFLNLLPRALAEQDIDYAYFGLIPAASALARGLLGAPGLFARDLSPASEAHFSLRVPDSLDAFLSRKGAKARKNLRRETRIIEEAFAGSVEVVAFTTPETMGTFFDCAERVMEHSHLRAIGVGFRDTDDQRRLKAWMAERGYVRSYVLYLGGAPCAFVSGINYHRRLYTEHIGFDNRYRQYAIGVYLLQKVIEDLCRSGCADVLDYGFGSDAYKERFSDAETPEVRVKLFAPSLSNILFRSSIAATTGLTRTLRTVTRRVGVYGRIRSALRRGPG